MWPVDLKTCDMKVGHHLINIRLLQLSVWRHHRHQIFTSGSLTRIRNNFNFLAHSRSFGPNRHEWSFLVMKNAVSCHHKSNWSAGHQSSCIVTHDWMTAGARWMLREAFMMCHLSSFCCHSSSVVLFFSDCKSRCDMKHHLTTFPV